MKTEKKIPERSRSVLGRFYCISKTQTRDQLWFFAEAMRQNMGWGDRRGGGCNSAANLKNFASLVDAEPRCTITLNAGKLFCFPVCGMKKTLKLKTTEYKDKRQQQSIKFLILSLVCVEIFSKNKVEPSRRVCPNLRFKEFFRYRYIAELMTYFYNRLFRVDTSNIFCKSRLIPFTDGFENNHDVLHSLPMSGSYLTLYVRVTLVINNEVLMTHLVFAGVSRLSGGILILQ